MTHAELNQLKDTVIIYYIWWASGHGLKGKNHTFYCSELNQEIWDYHRKDQLKRQAEEKGLPWLVVRLHKKTSKIKPNEWSIIEKSQ